MKSPPCGISTSRCTSSRAAASRATSSRISSPAARRTPNGASSRGTASTRSSRGPINSYVRYFKDQGYDALYRHPGYSWFYNRSNVNEYLGFDECVFNESGFGDLISIEDALFKSDTVLVDYLLNDIDSRTEDDAPLFLFSVSYQNHGPYSSETYWDEYVTPAKTGWSMESCCVINNYLAGIRSTIEQMRRLTRELEARDEPIVLVLFGDHKPWMGNGAACMPKWASILTCPRRTASTTTSPRPTSFTPTRLPSRRSVRTSAATAATFPRAS